MTQWKYSYGESNWFYIPEGNHEYTISDGTNNEILSFNDNVNTFNPQPIEFAPGTENLYYRAVSVGGRFDVVMVDETGKLAIADDGTGRDVYFVGWLDASEVGWGEQLTDDGDYNSLVQLCGGTKRVQYILDSDFDIFGIIVNGDYKVTFNGDGYVTSGQILEFQ